MEPVLEEVRNYGSPKTLRYKFFFYYNALCGIFRSNKVRNSNQRHGLDKNFKYSASARESWYRLYDVPLDADVPFSVYSHAGAVSLMIIVGSLGVNFKYLMHLKNETKFHKTLEPELTYEIYYKFEEVIRIKHNKAALVGISIIRRNGEIYAEMRDHFVIKNIPLKYADRLRMDEKGEFRGITRLPVEPIGNSRVREIEIPDNLPRRYAKVSGDYNMIHTIPFIANYFGYEHIFLQGLCTSNLVIKELCMAGVKLTDYSITFSLPVLTGQKVYLYFNEHEYRLQDEDDRILCFGRINDKGSQNLI